MLLLGGFGAGMAFSLFSKEWVCSAILIAVTGGLLAVGINTLAPKVLRWFAKSKGGKKTWGYRQQIVVLVALAIGCAATAAFSAGAMQTHVFEMAFDIPPPKSISDLQVESHYAGGPGDLVSLMQFHADRSTIDQLVAHRPMKRDFAVVESYLHGQQDWPTLWSQLRGMSVSFNPAWESVPPMSKPEFYEWQSDGGTGPIQGVRLIWDAATGKAYVEYSSG
jgi:hypothetical protein